MGEGTVIDQSSVLRQVPLFVGLPDSAIEAVGGVATEEELADGAVIAREGDPGDAFFVILDGQARVEQGGIEIGLLQAGDFLGEIALVDGRPRSAAVIADGPVRALRVGREEFLELFDRHPAIRLGIVMALADRLRRDAGSPVD